MGVSNVIEMFDGKLDLSAADNTPEGLRVLRAANERFRQLPWPEPFARTEHRIRRGDARDLSAIPDGSVHLIVTSPPYWTLKEYASGGGAKQLGAIEDYEAFLDELDKA